MVSPVAERAVEDCNQFQLALLKFISPNDAGATGAHQCGFYLPTRVHEMFSIHPPTKGVNSKHPTKITWQDGRETDSMVTWYGAKKHEYRLTRFGRDFPFLTPDSVGSLFVLIPKNESEFLAYVFDTDDDIEYVQSMLGAEVVDVWSVYDGSKDERESDVECLQRLFRVFAGREQEFPSGEVFSKYTWNALIECVNKFESRSPDEQLVQLIQEEYRLFQVTERKICGPYIDRVFAGIDDFLTTASSIMNRRKSRAGRSLENHVEKIFLNNGIPFEMRPHQIDGKPDLIVPGSNEYFDDQYPTDRLFVVAIKTTCKDRWRQVLNEGKRVSRKHLITMQQGISNNQLNEMANADVQLVVPNGLHKLYPKGSEMKLYGIETLVNEIKNVHRI